jgi:hypothetical protein
MLIHMFLYDSIQNLVTVCAENKEMGMPWAKFQQEFPDAFSVDNIVSLNYEKERNIYHILQPQEKFLIGEDLPEMVWISNNWERIVQVARNHYNAEYISTIAEKRMGLFFDTNWLLERHNEETLLNLPTTLSEDQYNNLLLYRQALRDLGNSIDTLALENTIEWPERNF